MIHPNTETQPAPGAAGGFCRLRAVSWLLAVLCGLWPCALDAATPYSSSQLDYGAPVNQEVRTVAPSLLHQPAVTASDATTFERSSVEVNPAEVSAVPRRFQWAFRLQLQYGHGWRHQEPDVARILQFDNDG